MHDFDYRKPGSVEEAIAMAGCGKDPRYLAGGMSLIPTLKFRLSEPTELIDLNGLADLGGIELKSQELRIGALARHEVVAMSPVVRKIFPALADLAGGIGDPQVRHRGTIGGSLANNDPAACYPSAVLGTGATIETNQRKIEADQFFRGLFETALEDGELITGVVFPVPDRACYIKFANPASRFSIVGIFLSKKGDDIRCAVTGAGACVFRAKEIEDALMKEFSPAAIENIKISSAGLNSDIHGSAEYRAHMITVLAKRAVVNAK